MSYDLFLTRNGDISFLTTDTLSKNETFLFTFYIAESDSLLFNFNIINNMRDDYIPNQLEFKFYVYEPQYDKSAKTVKNIDYIDQAIKIRLNTELGTIRGNENLGCELYTLMHSNIPDIKLQSKIVDLVKKAIADIIPEAVVEVHFLNTDYLNYHDSIKIVIINNEELYYYTI